MKYKIAIDYQNNNKLFELSKYISNKLNSYNVENFLIDSKNQNLAENEKIEIIKKKYGFNNDVIILSNRLDNTLSNGINIIYALRNNDKLATLINESFTKNGFNVEKYFQQRDLINTNNDSDYLINNTKNNETIVIYYENINDVEKIAESILIALFKYIGIEYDLNNNYYIVKKGDSLWSIANKYNTTVDELINLNNLKSNTLQIDQKIFYNTSNNIDNNDYYIVKKGDSLWSIANKYNTTVNNLINLNNLKSNLLSIGQKIIIRKINYYIVKKGDTLWSIAKKFNVSIDDIREKNNLKSDLLNINQKLII